MVLCIITSNFRLISEILWRVRAVNVIPQAWSKLIMDNFHGTHNYWQGRAISHGDLLHGIVHHPTKFNTLRPRQNGRHFADIFKCIFFNENAWILLKISLKFVPKVRINNIPSLVQIMARRRPGYKPLSEPMMVSLLTHICVTRPQWVKANIWNP